MESLPFEAFPVFILAHVTFHHDDPFSTQKLMKNFKKKIKLNRSEDFQVLYREFTTHMMIQCYDGLMNAMICR